MVSQKMKATASTQGFTLVELIVVITILAILGTIGFISLQGYSAQSRNSKRTSDIASLVKQVSIKSTEGLALSSFITENPSQQLTNPSVGGTGTTLNSSYFAGTPNFVTLGLSPDGFKDPSGPSYTAGSTTSAGGAYQFAATLEDGANKKAFVGGNYNRRFATGSTAISIGATKVNIADNTITIADGDIGKFRAGDFITATGITGLGQTLLTIATVSPDGKVLKMNEDLTGTIIATGSIALAANETAGLIQSTTAGTAVVNDSTTAYPY